MKGSWAKGDPEDAARSPNGKSLRWELETALMALMAWLASAQVTGLALDLLRCCCTRREEDR